MNRLAWVWVLVGATAWGQVGFRAVPHSLALAGLPVVVESSAPGSVGTVAKAFAGDLLAVTGKSSARVGAVQPECVVVAVVGQSALLDGLERSGKLKTAQLKGQWEQAVTAVVENPWPGVRRVLVVAGSDRRGASFALFTISRGMGVSPWTWWADVPVPHHDGVYFTGTAVQASPSVQYRGIFLNDEDWGLRPWAAKEMDPELHNVGPRTYDRIFELLLRLHANSLWPAMHPGTLAFNAVALNAKLADAWGIVMGSSHSEALLRNNVGEWDEKRDGPWNYQTNSKAMDAYWDARLRANGGYENFYTVGLRGVHDSGLEATGSVQVKAALVEQVMKDQRALLAKDVRKDVDALPEVIWLYKESLQLYQAGMKVPDGVTLGWTDDNYGYLRQLSTTEEQKRSGGAGVYYHVSYWGSPHDYLWLCTTPPAQIREEMTRAYDANARKYWVLNVGDLKPAEIDIDYFMQLAWDEPRMAEVDQTEFLRGWMAEQFATEGGAQPGSLAGTLARVMDRYYALNFVRKPEFMGFNGYNDGIRRTDFNPYAWGTGLTSNETVADQNEQRIMEWNGLVSDVDTLRRHVAAEYADAFFELLEYPVVAAAEQNLKFLYADRSFLPADPHLLQRETGAEAAKKSQAAYDAVQALTARYNRALGGKWDGMMDAHPRERQVFLMPRTGPDGAALPATWGRGTDRPETRVDPMGGGFNTVSIAAAHFSRKQDAGAAAQWQVLGHLGVSGSVVELGRPGLLASRPAPMPAPWLEYDFSSAGAGEATLALHLLPTSPVDAKHSQRYEVWVDGRRLPPQDAAAGRQSTGPVWQAAVLRNDLIQSYALGVLAPGKHTLRLVYADPGVAFQHLVITWPGAPPAYPVPPETGTYPSIN